MGLPVIFVDSNSILSSIGNTPLLDISSFSPNPGVNIFAKLESQNPSGSYKDRIALSMIKKAEKEGILKTNNKIIEPTSGNTGISLSFVSSVKNYDFTAVMPSSMSKERRKMIEAFGGKVNLKEGSESDIIEYAKKFSMDKNYFMPNQFKNPSNIDAAYELGKEISNQVNNIDKFIAGIGTGGTISGVGKKLREENENIEIIGFYSPDEKVQGTINLEGYKPENFKEELVRGIYPIKEKTAIRGMKRLWERGIFVGLSSGAALELSIREARKIERGKIVIIFADSGNRYLSLVKNKKGEN